MHFDDRLDTVLRLPDSGDGLARIQYRQLIDILGRLPADAASEALDSGFAKLAVLSTRIPAADQARLLRQPLQPITNPRLIAILAQAEPGVASAAIAAAQLRDSEWLALIPELPVRARGILRHRRDLSAPVEALLERLGVHDRGLPPATVATEAEDDSYISGDVLELLDMIEDPPAPTSLHEWAQARAARAKAAASSPEQSASAEAGIGAIVRRIEEFRKARESHGHPASGTDAPRLPLGDTVPAADRRAKAIDFATDTEGRINWADGPFAPSVFGLNLAANDDDTAPSPGPGAAIRKRQPLRAARLCVNGAPAVSGEWHVDAVPRFDPANGHFTGYCGRLRRARPRAADEAAAVARREAGRMREILHELRTPANAIQVAAEIVQQQLYGPAPHEYRALAAAIASDCAHILAGFEELDRLVKLETGALQLEAGECDLAQVLAEIIGRLHSWTGPRHSGFAVDPGAAPGALPVPFDCVEVNRLVWRLFAVLAGATAPEEPLALTWSAGSRSVTVRVALPAALTAREDGELFGTKPGERGQPLSAGMFGTGFTLRLAAAEAAAAGGSLQRDGDALCLQLPGLAGTPASSNLAEGYSQ
ncbi:sensor histidine kinase [Novosphingobium beihaiensis]|uniref:histidine kinase n=1 Tax=Novosphingobium beihaiensis TaxID=2930389 RepID=A0ABT0BMK8_9SPHN|nr:sensor histidine kinase [Novosphingobium beihaiensis]MCJ2185954.1 sensor histidine kinase [Novosphingobium beihaiensis]